MLNSAIEPTPKQYGLVEQTVRLHRDLPFYGQSISQALQPFCMPSDALDNSYHFENPLDEAKMKVEDDWLSKFSRFSLNSTFDGLWSDGMPPSQLPWDLSLPSSSNNENNWSEQYIDQHLNNGSLFYETQDDRASMMISPPSYQRSKSDPIPSNGRTMAIEGNEGDDRDFGSSDCLSYPEKKARKKPSKKKTPSVPQSSRMCNRYARDAGRNRPLFGLLNLDFSDVCILCGDRLNPETEDVVYCSRNACRRLAK